MNSILQGTTPSLIIAIDFDDLDLNTVSEIELTFKQFNCEPLIKHKSDCTIDLDNNTIEYHFSEEETLALIPERLLEWQVRFITTSGEIIGTKVKQIQVSELISDEVLK